MVFLEDMKVSNQKIIMHKAYASKDNQQNNN